MYTQATLASQGLNVLGACNQAEKFVANKDVTFNAAGGVYTFCPGLKIGAGVTVTFCPGVYVIFKDLYVSAQGTLKADQGTTIILGDRNWLPGTNDGEIYVNGGGNLFLTAPTSGPTASMAIIQATNSEFNGDEDSGTTHTIIGGGTIKIVGNW